jgi:hypothetical protein
MKITWIVLGTVAVLSSSNSAPGKFIRHFGNEPYYWDRFSVVVAEVIDPQAPGEVKGLQGVVLRPLATLSGRFEAPMFGKFTSDVEYQEGASGGSEPTAKGQIVLVVVEDVEGFYRGGGYRIPVGEFVYLRESLDPIEVVESFSDKQVEATLKAIQDVRKDEESRKSQRLPSPSPAKTADNAVAKYWASHGVVFAQVKAVNGLKAGESLSTVVLRPILTLAGAGAFDAGLTPEVAAVADLKKFGPGKAPAAGDKVLVVLERDGNSYRVAQEEPEYMPKVSDRRFPICIVKDFSDRKVKELVKSLKNLRKRQRDAEAKKPSGEEGKK